MTLATPSVPPPEVIELVDVSKRFVVRKDSSIKERIVTLGRAGRQHRQEFWALRELSLDIHAGSTIGLIGHNGSGKSTLLKVIGGIIQPTSGTVRQRGRIAALLELGAGFHPDLTGRENVFLNASVLGLSRDETEAQFDEIVEFAGIGDFIDTQVKFYSSGMYVRLAFAVAVHTDPDILLVDEVLAVGDEAFQRKCLDKIRTFQEEGRTIIIVSHSLGQITELCDRAVLLNRGEIVYDGDAVTAVARFRDLLEERRLEGEARRRGVGVEELHDPVILGSSLEVVDPGPGGTVQPGSGLVVTIDLDITRRMDDLNVAIQIDNTLGSPVYGTSSKSMGFTMPTVVGRRRVSIRLRDTRFGAGKYFINVSLLDSAGRHLHDTPQACSFVATPYARATGSVFIASDFDDEGEI